MVGSQPAALQPRPKKIPELDMGPPSWIPPCFLWVRCDLCAGHHMRWTATVHDGTQQFMTVRMTEPQPIPLRLSCLFPPLFPHTRFVCLFVGLMRRAASKGTAPEDSRGPPRPVRRRGPPPAIPAGSPFTSDFEQAVLPRPGLPPGFAGAGRSPLLWNGPLPRPLAGPEVWRRRDREEEVRGRFAAGHGFTGCVP